MKYRQLSSEEIRTLQDQGCYSSDWSRVEVHPDFNPDRVQHVRFDGSVKLGALSKGFEVDGSTRGPGIYSSHLSNCQIGDNVLISQVGHLDGYVVESGAILENVSFIGTSGNPTYGLGLEVEVLNEGGGRTVPLSTNLSAQLADLLARFQHRPKLISALKGLIKEQNQAQQPGPPTIQSGTMVRESAVIRNAQLGPGTKVKGVQLLEEVTVASSIDDPSRLGDGIIIQNSVILSGATVQANVILDKCLVGQGVKIGKQFSGENCLFFANSEAFHGEGVSLFAGPYTATHHKSTLLIAGMLSFYNAGSGTNQSNHMYKLGPLHQGVLERGSKTGSFSYLLWPCRVGPFSVVMDKHGSNFDTGCFPFSYLTVEGGKSMLTPAMNLFTVGTKRDAEKWPKRDRRKDPRKLDLVNFEVLSPFVTGKMIQGSQVLQELFDKTSSEQKTVNFQGVTIKRLLLKTCRKYYQIGLKKYFGDQLVSRLKDQSFKDLDELRSVLASEGTQESWEWLDLGGMLAPVSSVDELVEKIENGDLKDIGRVISELETIHSNYDKYAWDWYRQSLNTELGIDLDSCSVDDLIDIINQWQLNCRKLNNMILKDAEKEFDPNSKIGFGVDGHPDSTDIDFEAVRGTYEGNAFVQSLEQDNVEIDQLAENLIGKLNQLQPAEVKGTE